jgi:hypothetical protein
MGMRNVFKRPSSNQTGVAVRTFERKPGLIPGSTIENVIVSGRTHGYVMARSPRFAVWAEAAQEVHAQGEDLPWTRVARMWEGPRGAAISDDEQWCVVIGLGFIAFPLREGALPQAHWRRPPHARWELHMPMKGDLADAVLFTGVRALDARRFVLSTQWGTGNGWTTREWIYDADTDTIGEPRDIVDEARRCAAIRTETSAEFAEERQLVGPLRGDGAETTAEAGTTFEPSSAGGEIVLSKGRPVGRVLRRSPRFVVWQELGSMVCVEGDGLPWLLLEDMYGGAMGAAISDDEEWCVVVGCGFRARRLRVGGEFRSHGADPANIHRIHGVDAVEGHTFRLSSWGPDFLVREHLYDADRDALALEREWVDEERRGRTAILQAFCNQPLTGVEVTSNQVKLRFGDADLEITIAEVIRVEKNVPGRGIGTVDLRDDAQRAQAETTLRAWRGIRIGMVSVEENGTVRLQLHADRARPMNIQENRFSDPNWFGITAPRAFVGSWSISAPQGRLDAPAGWAIAANRAPMP